MKKRVISIILCAAMLCSATAVPAFAASEYSSAEQTFLSAGEKILQGIVGVIAAMIKTPDWDTVEEYFEKNGVADTKTEFADEAQSDYWYVGYGSGSLQTGKELENYVGGSLSITKKLATAVRDDQRVRTIAMSDGRGITVFAALDCFGLANSEVIKIRSMLADYAKEKNITSINISALHQHSCVDTYGMNGDLLSAIFLGPTRNILGIKNPSGQSEEYMEHLYATVVKSVKDAVESMEAGNLYYGSVDVSEYIRDKRDPQVIDPNINRFRFVPLNDSSKETWLINLAIHTVGMGAGGTTVTGDYPYYMEKYINDNANANFIMIQGAELAITSNYGDTLEVDEELTAQYGERYAKLAAFGKRLGEKACSIQDSAQVEPILNYASKTITFPTENNILLLAAKCGLLTNTIVKSGFMKYDVVTEIAYLELGKDFAVAIAPGELAPEIAFGGATTAEDSWQGKDWDYAPIKDKTDRKTTLVFGITNDQMGYILTDNSWHSFLCENEEIVATGSVAGSTFTSAFFALLDEVR